MIAAVETSRPQFAEQAVSPLVVARAERDNARRQLVAVVAALPDPKVLEAIADHLDAANPLDNNPAMQTWLRAQAVHIEEAVKGAGGVPPVLGELNATRDLVNKCKALAAAHAAYRDVGAALRSQDRPHSERLDVTGPLWSNVLELLDDVEKIANEL